MKKFVQKFLCTTLVALVLSVSVSPAFAQAQEVGEGTVLAPTENNPAQAESPITTTGPAFQSAQTALPTCGIDVGSGSSDGTIEGCAVRFFYYVVLYPSAWLASIGGQVFDYFTAYTLDADSYRDGGFVEQGWRIVRDIANISFIFILLYVAITFVLGIQNQNAPKLIAKIVLIALVINFSLFMTRAIIDAGNILGRVFYEKIVIQNDDMGDAVNYKTLSAGILAYVNPQQLLTQEMFGKEHTVSSVDSTTTGNGIGIYANDADAGNNNLTSPVFDYEVPAGFVILIILIAAAVNIAIAWVFFSVAIYFVGRTLGLWIMMIMSPVAFASKSIPALASKVKKFGFDDWLQQTLQLSFLVVIFMFFLFLTIMFLDVVFKTPFSVDGGSTVQRIMAVIVPFASVFFLLITAKKQAKEMSGEFGSAVGKALKYAVVGAVGAAGLAVAGAGVVGGAALRQTVGRGAAKMAAGADTTTAKGRFMKKYGEKLSKSSFDVRNVKIPQPAKTALGGIRSGLSYATDGAVTTGDLKTNLAGKGSDKNYAKLKEDRVKKQVEEAKNYAANEHTKIDTVDNEYEVEETTTDARGNITRTKRTVQDTQTNISLAEAQENKQNSENELANKKAEVHRNQNYLEKKRELDKREKDQEKAEKKYNDLLNKKKAGITVSPADLSSAQSDVTSGKSRVKYQKEQVKQVEDLYQAETNEVARFASMVEATQRGLHAKNAKIYENFAKSLENWAAPQQYNYRGDANQAAASQVRSMSNKEQNKSTS